MAKKKAKEIRITNPPQTLLDELTERAELSKRSIGKEAEYQLELKLGLRAK